MWDRRRYALICLLWFMGMSYRSGLRHLHEDQSEWMAFVTLWLPIAVGLGLLIAYAVPTIQRWWDDRFRFGG